jgi:hypothetical protein
MNLKASEFDIMRGLYFKYIEYIEEIAVSGDAEV